MIFRAIVLALGFVAVLACAASYALSHRFEVVDTKLLTLRFNTWTGETWKMSVATPNLKTHVWEPVANDESFMVVKRETLREIVEHYEASKVKSP